MQEAYDRAKQILREKSAEHKAVTEELLKRETLDAGQIKYVIENARKKLDSAKLDAIGSSGVIGVKSGTVVRLPDYPLKN